MCGRFTQSYTWRELVELYRLTQPARNLRPRYNIAPTTAIDVVRLMDTGPELIQMRWGLIPGWWKKTAKEVPSTFNARAETAAEKPMFRSTFKRTRCIVPASGYYEWRAIEGGKQPYFISAESSGGHHMASSGESLRGHGYVVAVSSVSGGRVVGRSSPHAFQITTHDPCRASTAIIAATITSGQPVPVPNTPKAAIRTARLPSTSLRVQIHAECMLASPPL